MRIFSISPLRPWPPSASPPALLDRRESCELADEMIRSAKLSYEKADCVVPFTWSLRALAVLLIFSSALMAQSCPPTGAVGTVEIVNQASGLALVDAGYAQGDGYSIAQWSYDAGTDAQWTILPVGDGSYQIVNQASGLSLVDVGYAQGNGYSIGQWSYDGGSDAHWQIIAIDSHNFEVVNQASGLALVDAGYAQGNGYSIGQWSYDGGSDAHWQIVSVVPSSATSTTIAYKAVWYRPAKDSLMVELADDTGSSPTPREQALLTLDDNFCRVANVLHANAVIVRLFDEDSFASQYGGGFTYDAHARPKQDFSVAQELIVSVAQKYGLKVIFVMSISSYHIDVDPTFGYDSPSLDAPGSYVFIHSLIDPTPYYGSLQTTKLSTIGLQDHSTGSFIGDARIAGWYFGGEWQWTSAAVQQYLRTFWPFFYDMVHYQGANTSFAATYALGVLGSPYYYYDSNCSNRGWRLGSPSVPDSVVWNIYQMKAFFSQVSPQPDLYGSEWYAGANYNLACISLDIPEIAQAIETWVYPVPASATFLGEGGTTQLDSPQLSDFYVNAINSAAAVPINAFSVWNTDGNVNIVPCSTGDDADNQAKWALFANGTPQIAGCRTFPGPPQGWHLNDSTLTYDDFSTGYGLIPYTGLTTSGSAVANTFVQH
jgi:ricin-type beta-trefoil lectin protein